MKFLNFGLLWHRYAVNTQINTILYENILSQAFLDYLQACVNVHQRVHVPRACVH